MFGRRFEQFDREQMLKKSCSLPQLDKHQRGAFLPFVWDPRAQTILQNSGPLTQGRFAEHARAPS
jgi:hypothetical protein